MQNGKVAEVMSASRLIGKSIALVIALNLFLIFLFLL